MTIRKGYSDGPFGQVHWRKLGERSAVPDLYCLHPAPFSGLAYTTIMPHLAKGRRVIAPDYPGHGGSDAYKLDPAIGDYADAVFAVIDELSGNDPVDLMGFHSGCLVAAEMAAVQPGRVRKITLVDVPAFDPETRANYLPVMGAAFAITPELECLAKPWDMGMTKRIASQGPDRSFEMFAEQLRHGRGMNAAFHAAFSYDVEGQFAKVTSETLILASHSGLLEATRRAANLVAGAKLIEILEIKRSVLDEHAAIIASHIV